MAKGSFKLVKYFGERNEKNRGKERNFHWNKNMKYERWIWSCIKWVDKNISIYSKGYSPFSRIYAHCFYFICGFRHPFHNCEEFTNFDFIAFSWLKRLRASLLLHNDMNSSDLFPLYTVHCTLYIVHTFVISTISVA